MARSFPRDVLLLDNDVLLHARFGRGRTNPQITQAKAYRLLANTFTPAVVTPELTNEASLAEVLRRLRMETGRWDKASLLLPDAWFRINILELPSLPEARAEADQVVRWSLKRTLPIDPAALRMTYEVIDRNATAVRVLAVSAVETTLKALEALFQAAGIEIVLIEPAGLNLWNAITVRESQTAGERVFFYVRDTDFTTAAFRGTQPLFVRSRNLNADRTLQQEIRLSASYLRETLRTESVESCYLAGNRIDAAIPATIAEEFRVPVKMVSLADVAESAPEIPGYDAELTACTGVFT